MSCFSFYIILWFKIYFLFLRKNKNWSFIFYFEGKIKIEVLFLIFKEK